MMYIYACLLEAQFCLTDKGTIRKSLKEYGMIPNVYTVRDLIDQGL